MRVVSALACVVVFTAPARVQESPQVAKYKGSGSINRAESFACATP